MGPQKCGEAQERSLSHPCGISQLLLPAWPQLVGTSTCAVDEDYDLPG